MKQLIEVWHYRSGRTMIHVFVRGGGQPSRTIRVQGGEDQVRRCPVHLREQGYGQPVERLRDVADPPPGARPLYNPAQVPVWPRDFEGAT